MALSLSGRLLGGEDPPDRISTVDIVEHILYCTRRCNTYRSDEPVSKSKSNVCPPILTGVKYSESYWVGVVTTVPSLPAAAFLIMSGIGFPNLAYTLAICAGPDRMNGFATVCWIVKAAFACLGSIGYGTAATSVPKAAAALSSWMKRMMMRLADSKRLGNANERICLTGLGDDSKTKAADPSL